MPFFEICQNIILNHRLYDSRCIVRFSTGHEAGIIIVISNNQTDETEVFTTPNESGGDSATAYYLHRLKRLGADEWLP